MDDEQNNTSLVAANNNAITPVMQLSDYKGQLKSMMSLVKSGMKEDHDYGVIPYTKGKSLFQPGADKLAKYFGLVPKYELIKEIEDWEKKFCYYKYKCTLIHFSTGREAGESERSCNNREKKWANKDFGDVVNTCQSMAQKRAFVAAVRTATMANEIFVEDEADPEGSGKVTRAEDPQRVSLMGRFFKTADDRGFSSSMAEANAKKKFNVSSLTEVTNAQFQEMVDGLVNDWKVVGKGNRPEKYSKLSPISTTEGETTLLTPLRDPSDCGNPDCKKGNGGTKAKVTDGGFCSEDCREQYYPDLKSEREKEERRKQWQQNQEQK